MSKTVYLKDYTPPPFLVDEVGLHFDIRDDHTRVRARLELRRNPDATADTPLHLDGEALELLALRLDGQALTADAYDSDAHGLTLVGLPAHCVLETTVRIRPDANTTLSGLYRSGSGYFTQCEAEGFRRITYFPDRPDVMARYTVSVEADLARCPVLLSNGNLEAAGEAEGGRHWARWRDPFPKPSYLFALVAARLDRLTDFFTTASGRRVTLEIYVQPGKLAQAGHAMSALKRAMAWDEQRFGLELDLDGYRIVAVDDFNMGAMENKGLNIFNTRYVLASPATATDADYQGIDRVVAHEYFHNWTGNRVTCRDWFQLSLKEGLTVFRDQAFGADMHSAAVTRIQEVRGLRAAQFPEDAGPMAHPVRPAAYQAIDNFYTATVYRKGAEVIRMMHTLLGEVAFQAGMRLYFERHDGQAVTCEDFLAALRDATPEGAALTCFEAWYTQAGTPRLTARGAYDPASRRYTLSLAQSNPPTAYERPQGRALLSPPPEGCKKHSGRPSVFLESGVSSARGSRSRGRRCPSPWPSACWGPMAATSPAPVCCCWTGRSRTSSSRTSRRRRCPHCCAAFPRRCTWTTPTLRPSCCTCSPSTAMPTIAGRPASAWRRPYCTPASPREARRPAGSRPPMLRRWHGCLRSPQGVG